MNSFNLSKYPQNTLLRVFFLSLVLFLSSCITNKPNDNNYNLNNKTNLNDENYWKMEGRMSVRLNDGSSEKIHISWIQSGARLTLEFSGSFGLGSHVIKVKSDGSATIASSNLNETAQSLDSLWEQFSPIPLPITAFSYWIKGQSHPYIQPMDVQETLEPKSKSFQQAGWQVDMSRYTQRKTYDMPNKIKLSNGSESASILIESWIFY